MHAVKQVSFSRGRKVSLSRLEERKGVAKGVYLWGKGEGDLRKDSISGRSRKFQKDI